MSEIFTFDHTVPSKIRLLNCNHAFSFENTRNILMNNKILLKSKYK